jgi:tetratricopeptide (TPR) repeat protein
LKLFLDAYNKRYPSHALNFNSVKLVDESRQFLDLSLSVTDAIEDRADIYVLTNLSGQPSDDVAATASTAVNGVDDKVATAKRNLLDILKSAQLTGGLEVLPTALRDVNDQEEDRLVIASAIQLAHKYLSDENAKEAAVVYKCILEVHPRHKTACILLAKVYEHAGRYKDAVKYLRQATAADSSDGDLLQQLGDDLLESGDTQEAVQVYLQCADRLSSAGPDRIDEIKVRIARAQRMEGNENTALAMLSEVLQRKKENVEGLLEYAHIVHEKGPIQAKEAMAICTCLMAPKQSSCLDIIVRVHLCLIAIC